MNAHPDSSLFSNLKRCSHGASWVVILFGWCGLVGWIFELQTAQEMKSSLTVQSNGLGRGASFALELPLNNLGS